MNFLGCAAVVALAQQNPQKQPEIQQSPSLVLKVTTHLVIVDAVVTDSSGAPVRDLKKEDFKLYEDGRPQEIQHFSFQEATRIAPSRPVEPKLPKNVITNIPETSDGAPVTVVLIDALNTPTADRVYLQRQLMKYLQRETLTGPVAIYMLSNRLHRLQDFTTDPELLKDVVKRFSLETSALTNEHPTDSVNDTLVREIGNRNLKDMDRQMLRALQEMVDDKMAAETDMRVAMTLDAMRRIAGHLGGYPGRKNLIWVSEAFPLVVTSEVRNRLVSSYTNRMRETANVLTDARVAIYPVDVRGLVTDVPDITLEGRTNNPIELHASADKAHDSMVMLAEQTGGRAFYNRNDIDEAIAQSIEDGTAYYTMGYYPTTDKWDGGFRKIEVRLQRDGLQVRNRKGYFAIDQATAARAQQNSGRQELLDALSPGSPNITSLPFTVQVDPPARGAREVLVEFHVDPRQVVFKKQPDNTQHAEIHFVVRAFDPDDKLVESDAKVVQMDLKPQTFAAMLHSGSLGFNQKIKLPPGDYLLKVGLRDVRSNLMGTISARIIVPK